MVSKLKLYLQIIGEIVRESGFEHIVFQSGLCTSGSLQGVLSGSHYNRGWIVHNAVGEALERILLNRFIQERHPDIPTSLSEMAADPEPSLINEILDGISEFVQQYENYRSDCRQGKIGKTAQFWLHYLDLIRAQTMVHLAVQENNLDMLIGTWKLFIPLYFSLNKMNYARYGSYYLYTLINMDRLYPGIKDSWRKLEMSVQAQEGYPLRTSIDQRGEQAINRDAKTSG